MNLAWDQSWVRAIVCFMERLEQSVDGTENRTPPHVVFLLKPSAPQICPNRQDAKIEQIQKTKRYIYSELTWLKIHWVFQRKDGRMGRLTTTTNRSGGLISRARAVYSRDDVSRVTTEKRQTLTMKNLQMKFLAEEESSASYSIFCLRQPFWAVHPTLSDQDTCMCKMRESLGWGGLSLVSKGIPDAKELFAVLPKTETT